MSQQPTLVSLAVNNLPFTPTRVRHYLIDHTHSNSHTVWAGMGKPAMPNADHAAWAKVEDVAATIMFLASPQNRVTRGAVVPVYGRS